MVLDPALFVVFTCAQSVAVVIHSFSGAVSTYGAWPHTFCRVHLCPICSCSYSFNHLFSYCCSTRHR